MGQLPFWIAVAIATSAYGQSAGSYISRLRPLSADQVHKLLPGHVLDESPYPADAGPLVFFAGGRARQYSGWGNFEARYVVRGNRIAIEHFDFKIREFRPARALLFCAGPKDRFYYRYERTRDPSRAYVLKLKPAPAHFKPGPTIEELLRLRPQQVPKE